jgi:hypothetical protein
MLHAGQLLKFLWGKAVKHAVYFKNTSLGNNTPHCAYRISFTCDNFICSSTMGDDISLVTNVCGSDSSQLQPSQLNGTFPVHVINSQS